jgi:hypothetical protein
MIRNWPVKVLSIALAIILFVFHQLNTLVTRPLSIPLAIETSSTLIPASAHPQNVRVTLRGDDDAIKSIADNDIEAYVDFTRHEIEGVYRSPVQIRMKGSASGLGPMEVMVSPMEVSVQLDRRASKTVPLSAALQGRVADGFDLVSHSITPQEIVLVGPSGLMDSVQEVKTDPLDLDGRHSNFTLEAGIANPNPLFFIRGSGMAEISCVIRPSVLVRSVENIPITLIGLDPGFEVDAGSRTGSVRLQGGQSQLDVFRPPPDFFTVDCSGISKPGTYTLPVIVKLPYGFSLIRREPEHLVLSISPKIESVEEENTNNSEGSL